MAAAEQHCERVPKLAALHQKYGAVEVLYVLQRDHPAEYARVKLRPELLEASSLLRRELRPEDCALAAWTAAAAAEDTDLKTRCRPMFADDRVRLRLDIL